jgi:Domain of unknown function (DUF4123)/Inner membrane component of T3SS, cytoplasmic domain
MTDGVPRLIVTVSGGPSRGRKAALHPGEALLVGRSELCGFVVPKDDQLAAKHFEIRWDGARADLRQLGRAAETRLNGEPVAAAEVPHAAWIRAGETDFTVHVEARSAPPPELELDEDEEEGATTAKGEGDAEAGAPPFATEEPEPEPEADEALYAEDEELRWNALQARRLAQIERAARRTAVERALPILLAAAAEEPLHAVLDAARSPRILEVLREAVEEHRSLYEGVKGEALDDVAPYLVRLDAGSRLLGQLVGEGWARRWGIFTEGAVPRREIRRHLRRFLMVEDEKRGEPLYFRFYDPGVLRAFWPTCSRRQRAELLGPLRSFLVEGERGEVLRLAASGKVEPAS